MRNSWIRLLHAPPSPLWAREEKALDQEKEKKEFTGFIKAKRNVGIVNV